MNSEDKYKELEQRLQKVYGECDGLLELVVEHLERHEGIDLPEPVFKARLLTDGEVDKWEAYKKIGTVEEVRALADTSTVRITLGYPAMMRIWTDTARVSANTPTAGTREVRAKCLTHWKTSCAAYHLW